MWLIYWCILQRPQTGRFREVSPLPLWISAVLNFQLRVIRISYCASCACLRSQVLVGQPVFLNTTSSNTPWGHAGSSRQHCTPQPGGWGRLCAGPYVSPMPLPLAEPHIFHICMLSVAPNCPHTVPSTWNALPCPAHLEIFMETWVSSFMGSLAECSSLWCVTHWSAVF